MSETATSFLTISRPAGFTGLSVRPSLLRPIWRNIAPSPPWATGVTQRSSLPSSFSMRITSAPRSPSMVPQNGPAMYRPKSRTRIPSRTPAMVRRLLLPEEGVWLQEEGEHQAAFVRPGVVPAAGAAPDIVAGPADAGVVGERTLDDVGLLDLDMLVPWQARARRPAHQLGRHAGGLVLHQHLGLDAGEACLGPRHLRDVDVGRVRDHGFDVHAAALCDARCLAAFSVPPRITCPGRGRPTTSSAILATSISLST